MQSSKKNNRPIIDIPLIYTEYRENIIIHNIDYFDLCIFATVYTTILNLYSIDVDDVVNEMVIVLEM